MIGYGCYLPNQKDPFAVFNMKEEANVFIRKYMVNSDSIEVKEENYEYIDKNEFILIIQALNKYVKETGDEKAAMLVTRLERNTQLMEKSNGT